MLIITIVTTYFSIWYLKTIIYISYYLLIIIFLNEFDHENYYTYLVFIAVLIVFMSHLFKTKNKILNQFLEEL